MLRGYDFAVFDCDGVVLASNALKSRAFAEALPGEPPHLVTELVRYHRQNGGVSRYRKFEHYFRDMRRLASFEQELNRALEAYARISRAGLSSCATVPGVLEYLALLQHAAVRCALNSGGDEAELRDVFEARELARYFHHILGSPASKLENMGRLRDLGFLRGRGVMFGDSRSDYTAAETNGLDFVFVTCDTEWQADEASFEPALIIEDFRELVRSWSEA
jgi:phosphoglycolate phosphatase-like HAD superfamily hydrolase